MPRRTFLIHIVLFLVVLHADAASRDRTRFARLGIRDGLSQSAVNCIFQDRQGFLWFGTQDGLNRYDGYAFTVFKHNPADTSGLNDSFILSISEDAHGALWIATLNRPDELNRFDPATETFTHRSADSVDLRRARGSAVMITHVDSAGVSWTGSTRKGLTRTDPNTGEKKVYTHDPADPRSLSSSRVYSVYGDRSGTIWVGTENGLNRFEPATGTFVRYLHDPKNPGSLADNWVWPIHEDRSGTLWVGTVRGGLHRFDRAAGTFRRYRHDPSDPTSLSDDFVLSIYQDRSGLLWVGTSNDGVNAFHPELAAFRHYARDPADPSSLINDNVISLSAGRSGVVWVGTRGGLSRLDARTDAFVHYTHRPGDPRTIAENAITSLLADRSGAVWIGTYSSGLSRLDPVSGAVQQYRNEPGVRGTLSDNRVYSLLEDCDGTLWVGTYGGGLNRFDRSTGSFRVFTHSDSLPRSLSADGVWALYEDREGTLWVGTYGGGLNRFDAKTETFTAFRHEREDPRSISDNTVLCITEDRSGALWVGTTGGLNRFDRAAGTFTRYREIDGLANDVVFGILEDGKGRLWMSTNKGLSCLDPATGTFRNYSAEDGLQGNEFNQNAYARNPRTGELLFGGVNGFTLFHPDSVRNNPYVPAVVFSAFRRYNTDDEEGRPIEEKGIAARNHVRLTYKDNVAIFDFASLSFHNSRKNSYAYRLLGFDDGWIQLGTEHRATFTNLDAGDYTLQVRASNSDGVWNEEGASLRLTVTPPWWRTTWAYAGYGLILLTGLYGLRRFEINRREQKALVRESELRARAAEAEKRALAAENDRKTKELEEARALQLSMLPQNLPVMPHLEIAVFMRTSTEVGGDYYDFQTHADGSLLIGFGDATGHGMQAGTIVTLMKGLFASDASRLDTQAFFNHCSRAIKSIRLGRLLMAFSMLRIAGRRIAFASSGMPPLFIHRSRDGSVAEILLKGMPLGAMKNFPYTVHEETLDPGDTLLLVTDGLPEQKDPSGEMLDYDRVRSGFLGAANRPAEEIIKSLVGAGDAWMNGAAQDDDITIMVIRMKQEETQVGLPNPAL